MTSSSIWSLFSHTSYHTFIYLEDAQCGLVGKRIHYPLPTFLTFKERQRVYVQEASCVSKRLTLVYASK